MTVDQAFKGKLNKTIELFDDGMCNGPHLRIGGQYLMYTSGSPNEIVPARGCTRSRGVEDAGEDLAFLKQYGSGKVATEIYGTVRFRPDEPEDSDLGEEGRTPLKDVHVTLTLDGKQFQAVTNSLGRYSVSKIPPGEYEISADLPGYSVDWAPDEVNLVANGCATANFLMKVDRRAEGTIRNSDGEPVEGVMVEMRPTDQKSKPWEQPFLLGVTDENGHYAITGIPAGDYYLGINIESSPTPKFPFPATYYPNTPDIRQAIPISVTVGAAAQTFDLLLPRRLPIVTIQGKVLTADGKPPLPEDRPQVRIKEPGLYGQIEEDSIKIDAEGNFRFDLCDGIAYSAFAFAGPIRSAIYSAPVAFTPTKENDQLILILDKTAAEFMKLRPK